MTTSHPWLRFYGSVPATIAYPEVTLYEALAGAAIDWSSVEFFWSDERFVPASDPHSNEGMARRALLGRVDEGAPYPGAKPHLAVSDRVEEPGVLAELIALRSAWQLMSLGMTAQAASLALATAPRLGRPA